MVAILFLAQMSFGTAFRFGEWGEKSIIESTLIVTKEKIDRVEETVRTTNDTFFRIIDPETIDMSCEPWREAISPTSIIAAAALIDEYGDVVAFFFRDRDLERAKLYYNMMTREVVPLIEKYDSLGQYKHLHKPIWGEHRLITHYTTTFDEQDYTVCLLYDTKSIVDELLQDVLQNVGKNRTVNVVDDRNQLIYGRSIDGSGEFIVSRRFPSTLYKWRLQIAPISGALFNPKAQARAKHFSQIILIPLALGVIVLGLIVLYLSNVRERRLSRLKSDFIANVTHEFKTPLSLIRMFVELLLMGKVTDKNKEKHYHDVILRETERLTSLIDNVLNISKIEHGQGSYIFKTTSVSDAVGHGVEICRNRLEKSKINLEYTVTKNVPNASIDDHAITLAVVNLIDNASKYARGTDMVGVELSHVDDIVRIDVLDHGVGIPSNQLKKIFERFYRVPSPEILKQRGSGIGLSLVKHIAEGHGGTVHVTSIQGKETRFSIHLPLSRDL
jgi:two-component system phosphate regulon sensor histidine kinase PhoR